MGAWAGSFLRCVGGRVGHRCNDEADMNGNERSRTWRS